MPSLRYRLAVGLLRRHIQRQPLLTIEAARRRIGPPGPVDRPLPPDVHLTVGRIAGVPTESYQGEWARPEVALVHVHGGAYVAGSAADARRWCIGVGRIAGAEIISIDYRLAPEHPFPAGPEDVAAVIAALRPRYQRLVCSGESAGGGVLLSALQLLHRDRHPLPDGVLLGWPSTDLRAIAPSLTANDGRDVLRHRDLQPAVDAYLGGQDPRDPLISPVLADLSFLPPTLVQVGDRDLLLDDARELARQLTRCGVEHRLDVWPDMVHAWPTSGTWFPEARRAIADAGQFVRGILDSAGAAR